MLSCPIKELVGIPCPGCGFQRSFIKLIEGDLWASLVLYPALLPIFFLFIYTLLYLIYKFNKGTKVIVASYIIVQAIVLVSYINQLSHL